MTAIALRATASFSKLCSMLYQERTSTKLQIRQPLWLATYWLAKSMLLLVTLACRSLSLQRGLGSGRVPHCGPRQQEALQKYLVLVFGFVFVQVKLYMIDCEGQNVIS